jgi:dihydroneopterin aldolase
MPSVSAKLQRFICSLRDPRRRRPCLPRVDAPLLAARLHSNECDVAHDRFGLSDLRFYAHHGAVEYERTVGQWFSADVEMSLDLDEAARTDNLGDAVDYRAAAAVALAAATGEPASLLERVAARIADALLARFPATTVRVRLRKFTPPGPAVAATMWVEIVRERRAAA